MSDSIQFLEVFEIESLQEFKPHNSCGQKLQFLLIWKCQVETFETHLYGFKKRVIFNGCLNLSKIKQRCGLQIDLEQVVLGVWWIINE